jgi:hypothetical protein
LFGYDYFYEDPEKLPKPVSPEVQHFKPRPIIRLQTELNTPPKFGPSLGGFYPLGNINLNLLYSWRDGETFTWNPDGIPGVRDNIKWRPYQNTDLRLSKKLFNINGIESVFYLDVYSVFNNKNMQTPDGYIYDENGILTDIEGNWTWAGNSYSDWPWWKGEFVDYMKSLKIDDGDRPGDYPSNGKKDYIKMPGFTPWTFLEKRDVFFGIRINF